MSILILYQVTIRLWPLPPNEWNELKQFTTRVCFQRLLYVPLYTNNYLKVVGAVRSQVKIKPCCVCGFHRTIQPSHPCIKQQGMDSTTPNSIQKHVERAHVSSSSPHLKVTNLEDMLLLVSSPIFGAITVGLTILPPISSLWLILPTIPEISQW